METNGENNVIVAQKKLGITSEYKKRIIIYPRSKEFDLSNER